MDVLEAGHDSTEADDGGALPAPRNRVGPSTDPGGGVLRIYARDGDSRIKLIADGAPVPDAERLVDVAFFETPEDAAAVAGWCADLLARSRMAAGDDGWHAYRVVDLPALLRVARNHFWALPPAPDPSPQGEGRMSECAAPSAAPEISSAPAVETMPRAWSGRRLARACFLAGQGWTAKQIALDPLVRSTPGNVIRQLNRRGVYLSEAQQGQYCGRLPLTTTVIIDRAAGAVHLTRDAFIQSFLIQSAARGTGMVAVSA